jgi:alpha-amylase/alpha-mannosidase (GH57 family)
MTGDRAICIHGHYYQPPRENPWLETIEIQDSASPFHDWNERIAAECYAPNTAARILDAEGRVRRVLNTYARTSFNVGPTLLSWMEAADANVYRAILGADVDSQARFSGHGSAIAQAYGHAILPLASRRDKTTQVVWGIRDFERRFRRASEGFWLPETAVDIETLEVVAQQGIRFTVLAPHQVRRVRRLGSEAWQLVDAASIDTTMPYLVRLPSGAEIAVFVYNGAMAHGVSFGDLLKNGDRFVARLLGGFHGDAGGLVHIATDGETYGHHHRFGEMALAYALDRIEATKDVRLTNYGEWLEKNPPTHEAEIAPNTSWSCAHGVERWRSDCGCTTDSRPGWNQTWRAPLRAAVDALQEKVDSLFAARAAGFFRNPWAARDGYIDVLLDPASVSIDAFFARHAPRVLSSDERVAALALLEMQRHALLAATSCGWYFADLAGIEAIQILRYAGRAIELAERISGDGTEAAFLAELEKAKSNDRAQGDGRNVFDRHVRTSAVGAPRAVARFALTELFGRDALPSSQGHVLTSLAQQRRTRETERLVAGIARVTVRRTGESQDILYAVLSAAGHVRLGARPASGANDAAFLSELADLSDHGHAAAVSARMASTFPPPSDIAGILSPAERWDFLTAMAAAATEQAERAISLLALLDEPGSSIPIHLRGFAACIVHRRLLSLAASSPLDVPHVESLLRQAKAASLPVEGPLLARRLADAVERELAAATDALIEAATCDALARAAELARTLAPSVDLWRAQNGYLQWVRRWRNAEGSALDATLPESLGRLGAALGIRIGLLEE